MMNLRKGLAVLLLVSGLPCAWAHPAEPGKVSRHMAHVKHQLEHIEQKHRWTLAQQQKIQEEQARAEQKIGETLQRISALQIESRQLSSSIESLAHQRHLLEKEVVQIRQLLAIEDVVVWKEARHDYFHMILDARNPAHVPVYLHEFQVLTAQRADHMAQLQHDVSTLERAETERRQQLQQYQQDQLALQAQRHNLEEAQSERTRAMQALRGQSLGEEARITRLQSQEAELTALMQRLMSEARHRRAVAPAQHPPARSVGSAHEGSVPKEKPYAATGQCPLPVSGMVQNHFGSPRMGGLNWNGVVIASPVGSSVRSVSFGHVVYAGYVRGFGWLLIIQHGGLMLLYGQNRTIVAHMGQEVVEGQVVAESGDTGDSSVAGVYFEARHQGHPVDPLTWCHVQQ